jgi:hypothetical protein
MEVFSSDLHLNKISSLLIKKYLVVRLLIINKLLVKRVFLERSIMNNWWKIILIFAFVISGGYNVFAQTGIPLTDTLKFKEQKSQSDINENEQNAKNNSNRKSGNSYGSRSVKRIKNGRPDMSRARGARPPSIVRPSGSGIPKGVGKPAGVGRKGGR